MESIIEIDGNKYTESEIRNALLISKNICSPAFAEEFTKRLFKACPTFLKGDFEDVLCKEH